MPLSAKGQEILGKYKKQYGSDRGKSNFYASINKGNPGTGQWHGKKKGDVQVLGR